jgi:hypothetical protein
MIPCPEIAERDLTPVPPQAKDWWKIEDVAVYLRTTEQAARKWMTRHRIKRCATNRLLTCQAWVDAGLQKQIRAQGPGPRPIGAPRKAEILARGTA